MGESTATATVKGLDIYHGDTPLDFHAMKDAGMQFIFIKATQGTGYVDPHFNDNWARAGVVSMFRSAYHFFEPDADPTLQANHLIATAPVSANGLDMVYMLDVEKAGAGVGVNAWTCARRIKDKTGRWPIIYSGDAFYRANLAAHFPATNYTLNIARYGHMPATHCQFWQYTDRGRIKDNPTVDEDLFFGTMDALKAHLVG